ncbi:hypothetical protein H6P81_009126 [Aristolochia fimbriata]|uniref:LysM domain-containing protein n=1 Tax=Aristolochia fimbriata TaxID=158543 RepID=A0AAV7EN58_ARIFI|nr:hypothetical protein H6P81_009126 [Aristolochia fimbriata]
MAKASLLLNLVLVLSLVLFTISFAEGRLFHLDFGIGKADSTLECNSAHGVEEGDTCFDVAKAFNLTTEVFNEMNPNLNCTSLFVGQWLCVAGEVN